MHAEMSVWHSCCCTIGLLYLLPTYAAKTACNGNREGFYLHTDHEADVTRCCKEVFCDKGYEAEICSDEYLEAKCKQCEGDTYNPAIPSSTDINNSNKCQPRLQCDPSKGFIVAYEGSTSENRRCACKPGLVFIVGASACDSCKAGKIPNNDSTACIPCGDGHYSTGPGQCFKCTRCEEPQIVKQNCTSNSDTVCESYEPPIPPVQTTEINVKTIWAVLGLGGVVIGAVLLYLMLTLFIHCLCKHSDQPSGNSCSGSKADAASLLPGSSRTPSCGPGGEPSSPSSCPNGTDALLINEDVERRSQAHSRRSRSCLRCPWCYWCQKNGADANVSSLSREAKPSSINGSCGAGDSRIYQIQNGENGHHSTDNEINSSRACSSSTQSQRPSSNAAVQSDQPSVSVATTSSASVTTSLVLDSSVPMSTTPTVVTQTGTSSSSDVQTNCSSKASSAVPNSKPPSLTSNAADTQTRTSLSAGCPTHPVMVAPVVSRPKAPADCTAGSSHPDTSLSTGEANCPDPALDHTAASSYPDPAAVQLSPVVPNSSSGRSVPSSHCVPKPPSSDTPSDLVPSKQQPNLPPAAVSCPEVVQSRLVEKVKNCRGSLVRRMKMNEAFLSDMMKSDILLFDEKKKLSELKGREKRAGRLLDIVQEKGDLAVQLLIESFVINEEQDLARLIDKDLCQQAVEEHKEDLSDFIEVRSELVREMDITEELLSHLLSNVLTLADKDEILKKKERGAPGDAAGHLLDIVHRKGRSAVQQLVQGLVSSDQTDLAHRTNPEYAKEYEAKRVIPDIEWTSEQKHAFKECYGLLITKLDISEEFLAEMRQDNGITGYHHRQLTPEMTIDARRQRFLSILERRPRRAFERFLAVLEVTEQTDMLDAFNKYLEKPVGSGHQVTDAEPPLNRHSMDQAHDVIEGQLLSLHEDDSETQCKVKVSRGNSKTETRRKEAIDDSETSVKKPARTENGIDSSSTVNETAVKQYDS